MSLARHITGGRWFGRERPTWEDSFRLMAFRVAYDHIYQDTPDLALRFAQALTYSVQPIANPKIVLAWSKWAMGRSMKVLLNEGNEPPAILRPIVARWREAERRRREFDGEPSP